MVIFQLHCEAFYDISVFLDREGEHITPIVFQLFLKLSHLKEPDIKTLETHGPYNRCSVNTCGIS